ncbi:MAG TPA: DUF2786 domain-containing protein [Ilumatobacter sp.]|nr:DUF2786 domain-containing protein [Ilumatobacter sp.]
MTTPHHANSEPSPDPDLIAKVRKLLAMAERTSNVNEADAFSRKAAELIAAHRIDPGRLRAEPSGDLATHAVELGRGAYVRGRLMLLMAVAEPQGCKVVFERRPHGTVAFVAGFRSDLEAVDLLYTSLHLQAAARMSAERRATAAATQQFRRSFLFGYAKQIGEMLATAADDVGQQAHPAQSVLPALRARERLVADFAKREFGPVRAARRPTAPTATGWAAGQQAAARADLGRQQVATVRELPRGA